MAIQEQIEGVHFRTQVENFVIFKDFTDPAIYGNLNLNIFQFVSA